MNIEQLNQQTIVNEWQLGQQLNIAVHTGKREKFNLLLSFLSDDVRDFSQFDIKLEEEAENKKKDLRAYFNLSNTQPLVNEGPSEVLLAEFNDDLQNKNMHEIRFKQLLTNEAILSRYEPDVLPRDVLENLPLIKQQRINEAYQSTLSTSIESNQSIQLEGVNANLLDEYTRLDFVNQPVQLRSI